MPLNIPLVSAVPDPPLKTDPANFAERGDLFLDALPGFCTDLNNVVTELNKITSGLDQTVPITAYDGATAYSFPDVVAGSDGASYRCIDVDVVGVDPVTDDGTSWLKLDGGRSGPPVGSVVAYFPGYFTNGTNGGYTSEYLGAAEINALINSSDWYLCDGTAVNVPGSPFYDGPGRYLPNITDSRFMMGHSIAGQIGGNNSSAHTHTLYHYHSISHTHNISHTHTTGSYTLTLANVPVHYHSYTKSTTSQGATPSGTYYKYINATTANTGAAGSGTAHNHGPTSNSSASNSGGASTSNSGGASSHTSSAASFTDNKPQFLSCHYIKRVK